MYHSKDLPFFCLFTHSQQKKKEKEIKEMLILTFKKKKLDTWKLIFQTCFIQDTWNSIYFHSVTIETPFFFEPTQNIFAYTVSIQKLFFYIKQNSSIFPNKEINKREIEKKCIPSFFPPLIHMVYRGAYFTCNSLWRGFIITNKKNLMPDQKTNQVFLLVLFEVMTYADWGANFLIAAISSGNLRGLVTYSS